MTLHEAIVTVLRSKGTPMSPREIADEINRRRLYIRGDGRPVPSSQISARVNKYPHLFARIDSLIELAKSRTVYAKARRGRITERSARSGDPRGHSIERNNDVTKINFLERKGFKCIGTIGELTELGLPDIDELACCGVYAITTPHDYRPSYVPLNMTERQGNVIKPWRIEALEKKWVEKADIVYYGLAGERSFRPLKKRLRDLIQHGAGKTTDRGPHRGGEILWQLSGYGTFSLWIHPTGDPPTPRIMEAELLSAFEQKTGRLPFANRRR